MDEILADIEERMEKALAALKRELGGLRAGRATPALLDHVMVEYYGSTLPVSQLASVTAPEPRLLVVQPWDKGAVGAVERAIQKSDLGITPAVDGGIIRLAIPPLTQERRQALVKAVRARTEEQRVAIRNIRREANERLRARQDSGEASADAARRAQEAVQKLTDRYVRELDAAMASKEHEVMTV